MTAEEREILRLLCRHVLNPCMTVGADIDTLRAFVYAPEKPTVTVEELAKEIEYELRGEKGIGRTWARKLAPACARVALEMLGGGNSAASR